jgi:NodT family efflux transporter outer membrane factor (OMF) lipoprotein
MSQTVGRTLTRFLAAGAACLLFSGCAILPRSEFIAPAVQIPAKWEAQGATGSGLAVKWGWWKDFRDPLLNDLIDRALRTNNDLAAATIKVRRAQLKSGLTDTNLTPSLEISANSGADFDLKHGTVLQSHGVSAALSYELDLWGKLKSARDADRWEAEATAVDRENTALSLIGTTASSYWQIAYLHEEIAAGEASIAYAEKTLALVRAKYKAGAVSSIDVVEAERTVAAQKGNQTKLNQQLTEARNAMAIIFDQAPGNRVADRQQLPASALPEVQAGLPASLLSQRPDLRAAEMRLRENLANVDATKASFYPSITLTGSLGSSSTSLAGILQNPVGTLGAGLALPFLQWNTAQLNIKIAGSQYEEAVVNFRQTLYQALSEVENALSARLQYENERVELERTLLLARKAEQLAGVRYRMGATGVQAWLDEQERRRSAETALAQNRLNRLVNMVKLYQALGGGMFNGNHPYLHQKAQLSIQLNPVFV